MLVHGRERRGAGGGTAGPRSRKGGGQGGRVCICFGACVCRSGHGAGGPACARACQGDVERAGPPCWWPPPPAQPPPRTLHARGGGERKGGDNAAERRGAGGGRGEGGLGGWGRARWMMAAQMPAEAAAGAAAHRPRRLCRRQRLLLLLRQRRRRGPEPARPAARPAVRREGEAEGARPVRQRPRAEQAHSGGGGGAMRGSGRSRVWASTCTHTRDGHHATIVITAITHK